MLPFDADESVCSQVFSDLGDRSHLLGGTESASPAALPHTDADSSSGSLLSPTTSEVGTGFQLEIDCRKDRK